MCMFRCIYVHTCVEVRREPYVLLLRCHLCWFMCMCAHTYVCLSVYTCVHSHMHVFARMYVQSCVHVHGFVCRSQKRTSDLTLCQLSFILLRRDLLLTWITCQFLFCFVLFCVITKLDSQWAPLIPSNPPFSVNSSAGVRGALCPPGLCIGSEQ